MVQCEAFSRDVIESAARLLSERFSDFRHVRPTCSRTTQQAVEIDHAGLTKRGPGSPNFRSLAQLRAISRASWSVVPTGGSCMSIVMLNVFILSLGRKERLNAKRIGDRQALVV